MKQFVIVVQTVAWVLLVAALITLGIAGGLVEGAMVGIAFITVGFGILAAYIAGSKWYFQSDSKLKRFAILILSGVWLVLVVSLGLLGFAGLLFEGAMVGISFITVGYGLLSAYIAGSEKFFRS